MANTTQSKILAIAPELDENIDPSTWNVIIADVIAAVTYGIYGAQQERAQRYLAAHLLTLSANIPFRNTNASGPVTSEKTSEVGVNYAQSKRKRQTQYDETSYGRIFAQIRKNKIIPILSVVP